MEMRYRRFYALHVELGPEPVECHELTTDVARLQWAVETGEVVWLGVNASHQRQGIARMLWGAASAYGPIRHSPWRTQDGDAFARAVGGKLPTRKFV